MRWAERREAARLDARLDAAARLRAHAVVAESEFFDIDAMAAEWEGRRL